MKWSVRRYPVTPWLSRVRYAILAMSSLLVLSSCARVTPVPTPGQAPEAPAVTPSKVPTPRETPPHVPPRSMPLSSQATVPNPADTLLYDRFEYVVDRDDPNASAIFQQQGRWSGAKTVHSRPGANGYLYTASRIPGYGGAFPGSTSNRVLVMEALPHSRGAQTDFYLQYGDGENPAYANTIPGNVWFQFWIYINHYGEQKSHVDARNKFIYPCNGSYPCHTGKWLIGLVDHSTEPFWKRLGSPSSRGGFMTTTANVFGDISEVTNATATAHENRYKFGHTNTSEYVAVNRWTLVKIHIDTSTESGKYEAWMRPMGGTWVKVAEWIDGVTRGLSWRINPAHVGGHRVIRMPTTMGRASGSGYDSWFYMDDFAMARSESGLPVYNR